MTPSLRSILIIFILVSQLLVVFAAFLEEVKNWVGIIIHVGLMASNVPEKAVSSVFGQQR